jgi:putative transposase
MTSVSELHPLVGIKPACNALAIATSTWYRNQKPKPEALPRAQSPRALSLDEREAVLTCLNSPRFVDVAPTAVYANLLDEGQYLCSPRTMYRLLALNKQVRERRNQRTHPAYARPELLAEKPNEVWSWDITKMRGPRKWNYFHLYMVIDIFSRCVVGWAVYKRESAKLARNLFEETCEKHGVEKDQLTVHADRGSSMRSKTIAELFTDLGVIKSHSRPYTSSDNPFSESQFRTMKYRPEYPKRFSCIQDARAFVRDFVCWYNNEHRHGGIGLMTPAAMHTGQAQAIRAKRNLVLENAYRAHPERFVSAIPQAPVLPEAVWINKPKEVSSENAH